MSKQTETLPVRDDPHESMQPVEVANAHTCKHKFIMKGFRVCECQKCGWGLMVESVDDFKKLVAKFGIIDR